MRAADLAGGGLGRTTHLGGRFDMRFRWTGLILAPVLLPLLFSVAFAWDAPVLGFLLALTMACIISYGTTIFLFLPSLFLLSLWRPMTSWMACLLGLALGAAVIMPVTLLMWKS